MNWPRTMPTRWGNDSRRTRTPRGQVAATVACVSLLLCAPAQAVDMQGLGEQTKNSGWRERPLVKSIAHVLLKPRVRKAYRYPVHYAKVIWALCAASRARAEPEYLAGLFLRGMLAPAKSAKKRLWLEPYAAQLEKWVRESPVARFGIAAPARLFAGLTLSKPFRLKRPEFDAERLDEGVELVCVDTLMPWVNPVELLTTDRLGDEGLSVRDIMQSISQDGFRPGAAITVAPPKKADPSATPTGDKPAPMQYVGDGNHLLQALRALGCRQVPCKVPSLEDIWENAGP